MKRSSASHREVRNEWWHEFNGSPGVIACCLCVILVVFSSAFRISTTIQNASRTHEPPHSCGEQYCAETSRKPIPEHSYVPPKANQVFHDPEFGSRMTRVTDERGVEGNLPGFSFISNSSAEINEWGKFDPRLGPNGGYYFYIMTGGGGAVLFSMECAHDAGHSVLRLVPKLPYARWRYF